MWYIKFMTFLNIDRLQGFLPPKLIGALCMLLWALSFSTAMAFAKTLDPDTSSVMVVFMRCAFGLMFFLPLSLTDREASFKTNRPLLHAFRAVIMCCAMACTYYAYRNLPIALASSIGMTGPLFTTLLAIIILKDDVSWKKWGVILLGYSGVLVMIRPDVGEVPTAVWIEILGNIFAAIAIITVKIMTRTENTFAIMFYSNVTVTALAGIGALYAWELPKPDDIIALCAIGGFGILSQYCSVTAQRFANPSFLAPFEYTRLIFAIPVGLIFFEEIPTFWMLLGSAIIILATFLLTRMELGATEKQATVKT